MLHKNKAGMEKNARLGDMQPPPIVVDNFLI
jgi:hypothetical protein